MEENGFTLTEILVVIFIISLLGIITFANYRQGGKQMALQRSAYKLAQDIRRVQEMAIGSIESPTGTNCAGEIPNGGYGIQFRYFPAEWREYYVLFADCDQDKEYDGPGELIEKIYFEKGIKIQLLAATPLRIIFLPPDPTTEIRPAFVFIAFIVIGNNGQLKTIIVNRAGLVQVL